ncbi:MAG: hypothetical protein QOH63_2314 [Acidobacteriota bacterium]|jgi:hypothetical protein|nr:hypothetical protein [Acidobacteriota bacterium]
MPTSTPPPYFPQGQLSPPDEGRAKKTKLALIGCLTLLIILVGGSIVGLFYLIRWLFFK